MKRRIAIIAVRIIGTLAGLLGATVLYRSIRDPFVLGDDAPWSADVIFLVVPVLIALYFVWIAYLVWFRFSPFAVRQVCGLLGFFLLIYFIGIFRPANAATALLWSLVFLSSVLFVLWGYRALSRYLNDVIFAKSRVPLNLPPLPKS